MINGWYELEERLPIAPGEYCVVIEGVRTFAPVFMTWDGSNWLELEEKRRRYEGAKIYWYPKEGE